MKKIEKISNVINQRIVENFWTRPIDWYKIKEKKEDELYEIRLYANFAEELDIEIFRYDMERLVRDIEDNTLLEVDNEYYLIVINKVNVLDSTLEIVLICEKITSREGNIS